MTSKVRLLLKCENRTEKKWSAPDEEIDCLFRKLKFDEIDDFISNWKSIRESVKIFSELYSKENVNFLIRKNTEANSKNKLRNRRRSKQIQ